MDTLRPIRDTRLGSVLRGQYRLEQLLGRGATGSVYRAQSLRDGSLVAVKILRFVPPQLASAETASSGTAVTPPDELSARRFAREARIIAGLDHPHIVKILAFERAQGDDEPFLVMELLLGETLGQRLKQGPLSPAQALGLYGPLCSAMTYAHQQGVVHRDLKPDNVFLVGGRLEDPRVLDFGVSKILAPGASHLTGDSILGTPAYMAPELMRTPAEADSRVDVFALGAMLFHVLTAHLPFEAESVLAVLRKVMVETPSARRHVPDLHQEVDQVLQRAMAKNPRERFQQADELLGALKQAVTTQQAAPTPAPASFTTPAPVPPAADAAETTLMMGAQESARMADQLASRRTPAPGPAASALRGWLQERWPRHWPLAIALGALLGILAGLLGLLRGP